MCISTWQKDTSILRFWIIVIPETEKPCLETPVCWAEPREKAAEPLLGALNVRSENQRFKTRKEVWAVISGKQSIEAIV